MAGYNPPGGGDSNSLQAMLTRLQAQRHASEMDESDPAYDLLSRFSSFNQPNNSQDPFGQSGTESPGLDDFPPPAPTPPSNFGHSHHTAAPGGLGPIGTMPTNSARNADQSANLLNLLKFSGQNAQNGQSPSHSSPPAHAQAPSFDMSTGLPHTSNPPPIHAPVPIPADPQGLLATLMKGNQHNESSRAEPQPQPAAQPKWNAGPPPMDTQAYLLNLLHQPKPAQNDQPFASQAPTLSPQSANGSSVDRFKQAVPNAPSHDQTGMPFKFGNQEHVASPTTKFEYNSPISQMSQHGGSHHSAKFDYASPSGINAASPRDVVSKTSSPNAAAIASQMPPENPAATMFGIIKKTPSATSSPGLAQEQNRFMGQPSPITSPGHLRRKIDGSPYSRSERFSVPVEPPSHAPEEEKETETVSEAITGLAEQADKEAREALERAENEEDLAEAAAKDIQNELAKEENAHVLEDTFAPEIAQSIRGVIDDTAQGAVADSWESAEADEIVVIEETPNPVRVYNFPMKPWISITVQETEEPRPQFRDEVILDIARLKKDFDQIDRNLVAATESYMVYGMSKAGGLRVIRQDDGKDAKLFTDTKDRIFNVAMSSTHSDPNTTPKESIIGTGISGTVYYVQMRNGEKDHLEDAHPEQYGFALPPIMISQEGGDSGGVLKTRARTSSTHPEFFAVGRGKVISIVWPSWIMQNNIFKPGHDRVVDTERLYRECFLRISTGKAGKDFTFSQDDTTIVSLDKSGRVKFWDVRNLVEADENSDPRFPLPAQTSMEVKEPLMTLNTTPEGEKAWPTSVLLLDKQRPYQKGWALRYMIVGMKQNHTLQLWDLALGKPVQEFNLPHTKESDPVCSIMYHPPSGMIVVGHPMRNSVYFLHLSAPKYTIKGLSQVDYIQRLVAKDPSIPEPDSTAVISGVREYSFDNKGVLRSVDMLANPATSAGTDEQALFELYAMHSKGVTGIVIKQGELGWSKDNKIIDGVDATEVGLVKIAKLKELPSAIVSEPPPVEEHVSVPLRIRSAKETPPPQLPSSQDQSQKSSESLAPAGQSERKETAVPVTPAHQSDKAEKKARKKREKAAAAERLAAENAQSNGSSQSLRGDSASVKHLESKSSSASTQPAMSQESMQSTVKQVVTSLGEKLTGVITSEFKDHREKVDMEFNHRDDRFFKSQHILLDKVSNVLTTNVQAVLTKTINDQFEVDVIPALSNLITKTISDQIDNKISGRVSHSIQNQMQKLLPNAVNQALQKPELTKAISDKVASTMLLEVQKSIQQSLLTTVNPMIKDTIHSASRSIAQRVEERTAEQIAELEQQHLIDSNKIDQLFALVSRLSDTVNAMASTQSQFQDGLAKLQQLQQQASRERPSAAPSQQTPTHHGHAQSLQTQSYTYSSPSANSNNQLVPFPSNNSGARDPELQHMIANVATFMERGDYEAGVVRWIQQDRTQEVFDEYIVKLSPQFLQQLRTLVSLSVASAIAEQLDGPLLRERVNWVEAVLHILHSSLPHTDPQLRDVVPNVMSRFLDRFQKLYMRINSQSPNDPLLLRLAEMTNMAIQLKDALSIPSY